MLETRKPTEKRLLKACRLIAEKQLSVTDACKQVDLHPSSYHYYKKNGKLPTAVDKAVPAVAKAKPRVFNVHLPAVIDDMISVVVLNGRSEAVREIVQGMAGVLRGN